MARGEPVPSHEKKSKTFLNSLVAQYLKPVYERLTNEKLMSRCLLGMTQNANESFHAVVWSHCPKHIFVGSKRVAIATALAVANFNRGSRGVLEFVEAIGCSVTREMESRGVKRDQIRVIRAEKGEMTEIKRRRAKRTLDNISREEGLAVAEGNLYLAGGADD